MSYIYIVRCQNDSLYTGITTDLARRMKKHAEGKGSGCSKYMRSHGIVKIEAVWECDEYRVAAKLEYAIKRLSRAEKLKLIEKPESFCDLLPNLSEYEFRRVFGISLEECIGSENKDKNT